MLKWFLKRINNKKGFTLVELVVVIAILGILSAIAVPKFTASRLNAERAAVEANLRTIESALTMYEAQNGSLSDVDDINDLVGKTLQSVPEGPGEAIYSINIDENGVLRAKVSGKVGGKTLSNQHLPIDWDKITGTEPPTEE